LYVAGGLGGHSNGLIALATYDGKVVAEALANNVVQAGGHKIPQASIDAEERRLEQLLGKDDAGDISPANVKQALRKIMWDKAGVEKDDSSLNAALDEIDRLRIELLPRMRVAYKGRNANYEWLDAIDLVNMIDACELIIHSSIERRESRGPFMRRDFPLTDNMHWLTANVMIKTANGFRFEQRPYELCFFQPDFVTRDNLEVAW
jgi:succinate dehydrogenase/fumarate reductase flavoprotein subunit